LDGVATVLLAIAGPVVVGVGYLKAPSASACPAANGIALDLGLSIARSVGTAHRATFTVRSQPAGGLDISVLMPSDPYSESLPGPTDGRHLALAGREA
jgi:hypothetical protein